MYIQLPLSATYVTELIMAKTVTNLNNCSYVLHSNCPFMMYRLYVPALHNYYVLNTNTEILKHCKQF
jgi:hypothetical protein